MLWKRFWKWLKKEKNHYALVGIFFILLQFAIFIADVNLENYGNFFWFCNHAPLLFAIFFFMKKPELIKALVNIGFLFQFAWVIDFLSTIYLKVSPLGVTQYIFEGKMGWFVLVPILAHIFSTNLAFFLTYNHKPNSKILFYSIFYGFVLLISTTLFTSPQENVNFINSALGVSQQSFAGYPYLWLFVLFFGIILPTHGIQYLVYWFHKTKKNSRSKFKNTYYLD